LSPEPVYESDPNAQPDSDFEPGTVAHLVAGNHGRLLDARRTPIVVLGTAPDTGTFELEVVAFEDKGARWDIELEHVDRFQFERGSAQLERDQITVLQAAVDRLDVMTAIPSQPEDRAQTERQITERALLAREFVSGEAPRVALASYISSLGLADVEAGFAERWVSNPGSGELVKGHAMILARLGLCAYHGKIQRSPDLFAGTWSAERRAEHIVSRLGFVRELYAQLGQSRVILFRGMASEAPFRLPEPRSFLSATFEPRVAEAHFAGSPRTVAAALYRQSVPIERLFMTYRETAAFSGQFRESEAVLLGDPASPLF
jgi:hypothetical protein